MDAQSSAGGGPPSSARARTRRVRTPAEIAAAQREATQSHLDGRVGRLEAYAATLEAALQARPTAATAAQLTRQLADVRRDIASAGRFRMAPSQHKPR